MRAKSINTAVLEALQTLAWPDVEITLFGGLGALPFFNADDDGDAPPRLVAELHALVGVSDGLIIATPEYAHGVPGALKNALDWLVSAETFPLKPVMLVNTAPRAFHAQASLRETLMTMSAQLIPEAFIALGPQKGADAAAIVADPKCAGPLRAALDCFVGAIEDDADAPPHL